MKRAPRIKTQTLSAENPRKKTSQHWTRATAFDRSDLFEVRRNILYAVNDDGDKQHKSCAIKCSRLMRNNCCERRKWVVWSQYKMRARSVHFHSIPLTVPRCLASRRVIDAPWPTPWWKSHPFVFHRWRIWAKFDGCGWTCHTWVLSLCCVKWRQKKRSGWEDCDFYLWSAKMFLGATREGVGERLELLRNKNRLIR